MHIIHCHSLATPVPICLLCSERDVVCNTPCMVMSVVTRHLCDSHPCHFAHTLHNLCVLRKEPWSGVSAQCTSCVPTLSLHHLFPSTNHGGCFIHQVCLVEHIVRVWCGDVGCVSSLSLPRLMVWPVIVRRDSGCFESLRDDNIRICPFEPFESCNDLVGMVCV